jgi:hypothetical protein
MATRDGLEQRLFCLIRLNASIDRRIAFFSSRNERLPAASRPFSQTSQDLKELRVRIRFLLFTPILAASATPLHASLGSAPQCVPFSLEGEVVDMKAPMPELNKSAQNYNAEDRDYLIRTIVFEAATEPDEGKAAVAHVILNREKSGRWGESIKEVVTAPWQFEPWMTRREEMKSLSRNDPSYSDAARVVDAVLSDEMPDPTSGATHFLNPVVVRQRRGGSLPAWASDEGQPIGRHTFFKPDEGPTVTELIRVSVNALRDALSCSTSEQQAEESPSLDLMPIAEITPRATPKPLP